MTMAFLLATFFAALFAIPSLQWQDGQVISNRFWIYWAFTIPSTILVLIIWWMPIGIKNVFDKSNEAASGGQSKAKLETVAQSSGSGEKRDRLPWHRPRMRLRQKGLPTHE